MGYRDKVSGISFIIKHRERLPYGNKDRGRLVPSEKGRRTIFVPSFGTMEKEEVDEVVLAAQEQEDERLKKKETTEQKQVLEYITSEAIKAPSGERAKTARQILKS